MSCGNKMCSSFGGSPCVFFFQFSTCSVCVCRQHLLENIKVLPPPCSVCMFSAVAHGNKLTPIYTFIGRKSTNFSECKTVFPFFFWIHVLQQRYSSSQSAAR